MDSDALVRELTIQALAAEMNLTRSAQLHGKESPYYQDSLRDFARVWCLLALNREKDDFHEDILAS